MKMLQCACVAAAAGLVASSASAGVRVWDWQAGEPGSPNNNAGVFQSIHAQYNTATQRLLWQVTFSDQVTDGYTLAVNDGPNPKGHAGELALVYFDASDISNVRVTTYAYNGHNSQTSYRDGSPLSGIQAPDPILTTAGVENSHPAILQATAQNVGSGRVLTLEMDASFINAHTPAYPGPDGVEEWYGIGFGELLGLWMHPFKNLNTAYDETGMLTDWSGQQGWFDGANFQTVPTPGALAMAAIGGGLMSRRRRA